MHITGDNVNYSINVDRQPSGKYFLHQNKCQIDQKTVKESQRIRRKGRVCFCFNNLRVKNAFLRQPKAIKD